MRVFSIITQFQCFQCLSKLFEKPMYSTPVNFIINNKLLYKYQFGFQKGKSADMALTLSIYRIMEVLYNGDCIVVVIYFDFSRHLTLLIKIFYSKNVRNTRHWWTGEIIWQTGHSIVQFLKKKSTKENIDCGVLQGSIIGSMFAIYI